MASSSRIPRNGYRVAGLLLLAVLATRAWPQGAAPAPTPHSAEQNGGKVTANAEPAHEGTAQVSSPNPNQPVLDILNGADGAFKQGRYAEAIAGYSEVISMTGIDAALVTRARLGKAWASMAKTAVENPTGWGAVKQSILSMGRTSLAGLGTIAGWIVVLALIVGIVGAARFLIPAKYDLLIDLQDLSASDRDNGSHLLSAEVQQILFPPAARGDELIFESMRDFGGGSSASIKPMAQMPGLDALLSTAPVTVGPLQFTPASVLALLRGLFQPRHRFTVAGALFMQGSRTAVSARLLTRTGAARRGASWLLSADGTDGRRTVLRQIAARVTIEMANGRSVSADPQSVEYTLAGTDLLRSSPTAAPSQATLRAAAEAFQNAVGYDPGNWMARFNLSVLLRQLGDEEEAIQHCQYLENVLAAKNRPASLRYYVGAHPHFGESIKYNHALALAQIRSWGPNKEAIELLDGIIAGKDDLLKPLANSARAAALLFQFDQFRRHPVDAAGQMKRVEEEVADAAQNLNRLAEERAPSRSVVLARAVALNARGYIEETRGKRAEARADFEAAATLDPDFVEVHLNLGRLCRHGGKQVAPDWIVRAKSHLSTALSLQPENREANYQMGRLLADDAVRKFSDALPYFDKAQPHSMAAFYAGNIYCDSAFPGFDMEKGIEQLRTAANLAPDMDFRLVTLTHRLIDYANQLLKQAKVAAAQAALNPASILDRDKDCARAGRLLQEADSRVGRLKDADEKSAHRLQEHLSEARETARQICSQGPPPGQGAAVPAPADAPPKDAAPNDIAANDTEATENQ